MEIFDLQWSVDSEGYRIERKPPVTTGTILGRHDGYDVIVRNGGPLTEYEPFKIDCLWQRLAKAKKSTRGALDFVSQYGFLDREKADEMEVSKITEAIGTARQLVVLNDKNDWKTVADRLDAAGQNSLFGIGGVGRLGVLLTADPGAARPALRFRPGSLLSAILVQYLDDVTGGAELRECARPGCTEWFKYGPGTNRRETARYCTPKCQKADAYMKSKTGAKR